MILIGTDDGIHRWFQGGPWPVFHSLQHRAIKHMASSGGGSLTVIDDGGAILESRDNGLSWRVIPAPEGTTRPTAIATGSGLEAPIVVAFKPLSLYFRVFGSAKAWTKLPEPAIEPDSSSPPPFVRVLTQGKPDSAVWYAAISGKGLWRSGDSGASWKPCAGLPNDIFSVRVAGEGAGLVVAATSDGVWISEDGGETWADRSKGLESARYARVVAIDPDDPNLLLAGAAPKGGIEASSPGKKVPLGFALYESKDRGKTWSHVRRGFPERLEFDSIIDIRHDSAATEFALVAFDSGEMWRTRNAGEWWEPFSRQIQSARTLCAVT